MIKRISLLFLSLCTIALSTSAQQELEVGESFGIDILPVVISLGGGVNSFEELELLYRVNNESGKQLRLKVSINNRSVVKDEVVFANALGFSCSGETAWTYNRYLPTQNIHVAAGLAKYFTNSSFPLYGGVDFNFGVYRGTVETRREHCDLQDQIVSRIESNQRALTYMVGITPVLGTELNLNRLKLIIEFGLTANYNFGKHPYQNEEGDALEKKVSRTDLLLNKFLNDMAIVYRF